MYFNFLLNIISYFNGYYFYDFTYDGTTLPQGGILSLFLINIYVADQPTMRQTIVAGYADEKVILSINVDSVIISSNL